MFEEVKSACSCKERLGRLLYTTAAFLLRREQSKPGQNREFAAQMQYDDLFNAENRRFLFVASPDPD